MNEFSYQRIQMTEDLLVKRDASGLKSKLTVWGQPGGSYG